MTVSSGLLRTLIDGLAELYAPAAPGEYPGRAIGVVTRLIPAESCSYNEILPGGRARWWIDRPEVLDFPDAGELFRQHLPEHPVLIHHGLTGDGQAKRISDFLTDRQFRALGLYRDFYRLSSVEYQTALLLPGPAGQLIGVAVNRVRSDFTDEELGVLDLLRPHITQAAGTAALLSRPAPQAARAPGGTPPLTPRQMRILELVAAGYPDRTIARLLGISTRTVHAHLQHTYRLLGVASRTEALAQLRAMSLTGAPDGRPVSR